MNLEVFPVINHFSTVTSGFTLPVWVTAAAKAATTILLGNSFVSGQKIRIRGSTQFVEIPVRSATLFSNGQQALAITFCDSGYVLDITRDMELIVIVQIQKINTIKNQKKMNLRNGWLNLVAGEGVGIIQSTNQPSVSQFCFELFEENLKPLLPEKSFLSLEVIIPKGKYLATKTSNSSFGIVDGLSLIGTQAEVQISASPDQLKNTIENLRLKVKQSFFSGDLVLVLGENGLSLAQELGVKKEIILKVGNWIGPLLVAASEEGVKNLLLFGYHGKLIKLAGGIFHTHNHLADGRLEILTYFALLEKIPLPVIQDIVTATSVEDAFLKLSSFDLELTQRLWNSLSLHIEKKSSEYVNRYHDSSIRIGAALFDRRRNLNWLGPNARKQVRHLKLITNI